MRSLEDVRLPVRDGLTVLIGENGAGKSSLLEAVELLYKPLFRVNYLQAFNDEHGGLQAVLRQGASSISVGLRIEGDDPPMEYGFRLARRGLFAVIDGEWLRVQVPNGTYRDIIHREGAELNLFREQTGAVVLEPDPGRLFLGSIAPPATERIGGDAPIESRTAARAARALEGLEPRVPFETRAWWVTKERGTPSPLRDPVIVQHVSGLGRVGENLANCLYGLQSANGGTKWEETLDLVRLGLGPNVRNITFPPDAGGGRIAMRLELEGGTSVPQMALSDGQLAYLAFVALSQVGGESRSLVMFDEPETHLHPALLGRVLQLFERMSTQHPVILSTQSDRLLDALEDPAHSVIVCELDRSGIPTTRLARLDPEQLARWLEKYRGLGELRAEGAVDLTLIPIESGKPE